MSEIFLRKSSGLVRAARPIDVFIYNIGLISVGIAISLTQSLGAPFYPGANQVIACLIAGGLMAVIALGFWFWTIAIPRSGGIYTFLSRSVSPGFGFAMSFVDSFTWLFYNSLAATLISTIGLAPLFFSLYRLTNNHSMLTWAALFGNPSVQFGVGLVAIGIATFVLLRGMRMFFHAQKVIFAIALIGTFCAVIALLKMDKASFAASFSQFAATHGLPNYSEVARASGQMSFAVIPTIGLAMWPILSFVGSIFSVAIGGEVQEARRSQGIGMFGSILFATCALTLLLFLSNRAFGAPFLADVWKNEQTAKYSVGFYLPTLISIGASPWLGLFSSIGFLAWAFFWLPATFVYSGRSLLAWSLDRLAPPSIGFVHDKLHTPVTAILIVSSVNVAMLALFLFTGFFGKLVLVLAAMFAWLPTMAAGAIFPWFRRSLFQRTDAAKHKLFGLPTMTIACTFSFAATLLITYLLWNDPIAAGHDWKSLLTIGVTFAVGIVWYSLTTRRRKRQGFPVHEVFKDIPVE